MGHWCRPELDPNHNGPYRVNRTLEGGLQKQWNISDKTDWDLHVNEKTLAGKLKQREDQISKEGGHEMVEIAYDKLVRVIKEAWETCIGFTNPSKRKLTLVEVKKAIKRFQQARRRWRTACTIGKRETLHLWQKYQNVLAQTKKKYEKAQMIERDRWREGGSNSKTLWNTTKETRKIIKPWRAHWE